MVKVHRAKNSGTSAAEEPDSVQVWCDICKEEKDPGGVEKIGGEDVCGRCKAEAYRSVSDDADERWDCPKVKIVEPNKEDV